MYELQQKDIKVSPRGAQGVNDVFVQSEESISPAQLRLLIIVLSIWGIIYKTIYFFGATFFLQVIARIFLYSSRSYSDFVVLYGLSTWISILGSIITLLMVKAFGSIYAKPTAAAILFVTDDPSSTIQRILSEINFFSIWQASVIGIGLSKLSEKKTVVGIGVVVGFWIFWVLISARLNLPQ
jgi:hypothetical protein